MPPILAGVARLAVITIGGFWLVAVDAAAWTLFALIGASMAAFGLSIASCRARTGPMIVHGRYRTPISPPGAVSVPPKVGRSSSETSPEFARSGATGALTSRS
ncbi:MAG: hypothetical protein M5U07_15790 [Xanthobacteraceae bacterium]|nr:hypothetical protein [Xanthobacteraceae bacterium]